MGIIQPFRLAIKLILKDIHSVTILALLIRSKRVEMGLSYLYTPADNFIAKIQGEF